jgi:hypothetical protein
MFGSALYDAIKTSPADEMLANDWLKFFKTKQNVKYNDGRSASIQTEELFDTNLANLDPQGNLIGGLLAAAKNINAPISKQLLLAQVKNNPVNQMKLVEFKSLTDVQQRGEELTDSIMGTVNLIKNKYPEIYKIKGGETAASLERLEYYKKMLDGSLPDSGRYISASSVQSIGKTVRDANKIIASGIKDPQDLRLLEENLIKFNRSSEKLLVSLKDNYKLQHNGQMEIGTYKLPGEVSPRELVWVYPNKIPGNESYGGHFSYIPEEVAGKGIQPTRMLHVMYGKRFTPNGERVSSINELQSDIQQEVFEDVKKKSKKRINPFNREAEAGLLIKPRENIQTEINNILKKGMYATEDDAYKLNKLLSEQQLIKKGLTAEKQSGSTDYLPMFDTKQYSDFGVKTVARKAAEEGDQWVSVVPVNLLSRRNGAIPGNEVVYGYANGKGVAKKGEAIIPEIMRKLANQYKTEAKTIQVSKSDPTRPWKVTKETVHKRYEKYDSDRKEGVNELEVFTPKHHLGAFRTEEEATNFYRQLDFGKSANIEFIPKDNPELYDLMYALRVTPDMANKPFKLYKHTGGLIEDIFKAPLI